MSILLRILPAAGALVLLNAASNVLNQVFDVPADRINKPHRPIPAGLISPRRALAVAAGTYAAVLGLAGLVGRNFLLLVAGIGLLTVLYSAPPVRLKRFGGLSNLAIAACRGVGLFLAGAVALQEPPASWPWAPALLLGLFLLGASSTKDFADVRGDTAMGDLSLPIVLGFRGTAWFAAGSMTLAFALVPVAVGLGALPATALPLTLLAGWSAVAVRQMLRRPMAMATERNHPSWKHMYLILLTAQAGFAVAYAADAAAGGAP